MASVTLSPVSIDSILRDSLDYDVLEDYRSYLYKFNEALHYQAGLQSSFEEIPGITAKIQMAEPNITQTPRYHFIAKDLAFNDLMSLESQILNIIVTHLIGGHETPRAFSGQLDRKLGFIDFDRVAAGDQEYIDKLEANAVHAKENGIAIWNDITIRSSIQVVSNKYADANGISRGYAACLQWMASWIADGTIERLLAAETFKEVTEILLEKPGVGKYIAYHSASGLSSHPRMRFGHEEDYCLAGPGACRTIKAMFKEAPVHPNDVCIWWAANQERLVPDLQYHEYFHNIKSNDTMVYKVPQSRLFALTSEISLCLFNTFKKNRSSPKEMAKREKPLPDLNPMLEKLLAV